MKKFATWKTALLVAALAACGGYEGDPRQPDAGQAADSGTKKPKQESPEPNEPPIIVIRPGGCSATPGSPDSPDLGAAALAWLGFAGLLGPTLALRRRS